MNYTIDETDPHGTPPALRTPPEALIPRPTDPRTRDRLAPPPPRAPKPHPHRRVTRADLALRPNGANGPKQLRRRLALDGSPSPNALPTRDRHAPEPPSAYPNPTNQPVTIQRHDGPSSHTAQA